MIAEASVRCFGGRCRSTRRARPAVRDVRGGPQMIARSAAAHPVRVAAVLLCLAVAWIHVQDQGGFPGGKTPHYVGVGYYLLEAAGVLCAALLLAASTAAAGRAGWLL